MPPRYYSVVFLLALSVITSSARPTLAALNRRFDTGRIGPNQQAYLWPWALCREIRPELRGTSRETAILYVHRLSDGDYSGNHASPEWAVLNRRGFPVRPRAEFFVPELNFITADADEYTLTTTEHEGFDRLLVYVQSGDWRVEVRLADFDSIWQPIETLSAGHVGSYLYEHDFFRREYRLIRL